MQVTREELNPCTIQLQIVCSPEEVQEGFEKALKQIAKKIRLPGFRPGHAPRAMVEQVVPKEELYEKAADTIVRSTLKKAIEEQELTTDRATVPNVELTKFEEETKELEYTAKVPLPPVVELGDYKGLPVEKPSVDVSDEDVQFQIDELRKRRQTREAITDRGVEEGDVAVVNIKLEGESDGRNFMTVAGQTFPSLDEALRGMKVEEMKSLELAFPENFQEKDWAGKTMKALVTLNSLSAVKLPELDDEFAQSLKTESVDELKARMRERIGFAKEQMLQEMVSEQLLERLLERSTVHVPDMMWENLAMRRLQETHEELQKNGKSLEDYAKENGMTLEEHIEAVKEQARQSVVRALLIREVFFAEKMQLGNEDLNEALYLMANEYGLEPKAMLDLIQRNQAMDELQFRAMARKVSGFLSENAETKEIAAATK